MKHIEYTLFFLKKICVLTTIYIQYSKGTKSFVLPIALCIDYKFNNRWYVGEVVFVISE